MSDTLDRELNIKNSTDATGRKWVIHRSRGNGLCHIRPDPDREDAVIPALMGGQWTVPGYLKEKLALYLKRSWDESEAVMRRNARTEAAAKEWDNEGGYQQDHPDAVFVDHMPVAPAELTPEQLIQLAVDAENAEIAAKKETDDGKASGRPNEVRASVPTEHAQSESPEGQATS